MILTGSMQTRPEQACAPQSNCQLCPRLVAYRHSNAIRFPSYHNGAVPSFGALSARLLIVGLAPGLHGANQTGRPFTGDYAGDLLYETLHDFGFAAGTYQESADDGLHLVDCRLTNAVRCAPPDNKPTTQEAAQCRPFLADEINAMPSLRLILALGGIAHANVIAALGQRPSRFAFQHGARHQLPLPRPASAAAPRQETSVTLVDSYHCSRYNTNTKRLTPAMFQAIFAALRADLNTMPNLILRNALMR
jgi:uracil-DNA glycosylase